MRIKSYVLLEKKKIFSFNLKSADNSQKNVIFAYPKIIPRALIFDNLLNLVHGVVDLVPHHLLRPPTALAYHKESLIPR